MGDRGRDGFRVSVDARAHADLDRIPPNFTPQAGREMSAIERSRHVDAHPGQEASASRRRRLRGASPQVMSR